MYINIEPRKINAKINLNKPESFFCPWHFVNMLTVPLGSSSSYLQLLFTSAKLFFFFWLNFFNFWDLQIALSHAWNVAMWFWCIFIWWVDGCWVYLWFTVWLLVNRKRRVFFFFSTAAWGIKDEWCLRRLIWFRFYFSGFMFLFVLKIVPDLNSCLFLF